MADRHPQKLRILGNTYSCRDRLKAYGAVWEPILSAWLFLEAPKPAVMEKLSQLGLRLEAL